MARRSTKRFDYGEGIYYFDIKKGFNNNITIKRTSKEKAIEAYTMYLRTQKDNCHWLGKWNGKKFVDDNIEEMLTESAVNV